jgi:hypothetical protein
MRTLSGISATGPQTQQPRFCISQCRRRRWASRTAISTRSASATADGAVGDPIDTRKARLVDVLEDVGTKTLQYLYDFGDGGARTR